MKVKVLPFGKAMRAALLVLLLSVVGMTNAKAQSNAPTGAINGLFTINGNGDQVYFSQGNLQYQASTNTWRFAENQWDFVGESNANASPTYDGWIDLFAWATSGYDHATDGYQPWSEGCNAYDGDFLNLYDRTGKADWGYNAISNGGNEERLWRTCTETEWRYLLFDRQTASGIRFAKATIGEINGIIMLPDNWVAALFGLNNTNEGEAAYSSNVISLETWMSVFEANGAVFLPASGRIQDWAENDYNQCGMYWNSNDVYGYLKGLLSFGGDSMGLGSYYTDEHYAVRLVRATANASYFIEAIPNPAGGGTISGAGTYDYYAQVTLTATANEGYTFYQWKENGNVVSTENPYSFVAFFDRYLEAVFLESSTYPLLYSYNGGDHTATVTGRWDGVELEGELVIPETVMHNGEVYTVTAIGDNAFHECSNMTSVVFPNTLVSIGNEAFSRCYGLTSVIIPSSVVSIGFINPFVICSNLESIIVEEGNMVYDSRDNSNAIIETSTNILKSGSNSTVIPNTISELGMQALAGFSFTTLTLPASLQYLGQDVFMETSMELLNILAPEPPGCHESAFYGFSTSTPISVPCGSIEAYQNAEGWNEFTNFFEMCPGTITVTANHEEYGTVSGGGSFEAGEICTVTATPYEGYYFLCWMEDGQGVSTEATYTFPVYRDHNLTGIFYVSLGDENIINGDFRHGNVGFISEYEYNYDFNSSGQYYVDNNAHGYPGFGHGGTGNFMMIDGATESGVVVWSEQISVVPNTYYDFSTWVCTLNPESRALLQFSINGTPIGVLTSPSQTNIWEQFTAVWYSGDSSTATITIVDLNTEGSGNDFGLDDISFRELYVEIPLHWTPNTIDYEENMAVTAVVEIDGVEQRSTLLELGAFSGDECRGSQMPLYFVPTQRFLYQMTVSGEEGDEIAFRLYDHATNEELELVAPEAITFTTEGFGYGTLPNPIVLNFRHSYDITATANPEEGGTVNGGGTYFQGETATLTATANTGYHFVNWTKDGEVVPIEQTYSFEVTEAGDYVANFELNSYAITATANLTEGGTVTGTGTYDHFSTCTLTATPNANYVFVHWTLDGEVVSTEATYSFEVTGAGDYTAYFNLVQTTNFTAGWNWWSTYIEQEGTECLEALENGLGANGITIKSQNDGYVSYMDDYGWYGSLEELYIEQSYRVKANAPCTVQLQGLPTNPSNYPVGIAPGWTWMGFPWNQSVSVESALEGFEPEANDLIKGRNAFTMYYSENGYSLWFGPLNSLEPGQGYVYYSNSGEAKTLTLQTIGGRSAQPNVTTDDNLFRPEAGAYADNMTLTAVVNLDGAELRTEGYEVAAFCNGECRGSAKLAYFAPIDRYVALLTLFGNDGDKLEFVLADESKSTWTGNAMRFATDGRIGSLTEPHTLCFGVTGIGDNASLVSVYPNPSKDVFNINGEGIRRIDVYNAFGQVVLSEETKDETFRIDLSDKASGFYLLRVVTENGVLNQQLIKE